MFPSDDTGQGVKRKTEEADWSDSQDQARHEQKKLRPLPFRTSPTSKHVNHYAQPLQRPPRSVPSTLTPVESSEDEDPEVIPDELALELPPSQANSASSLEVRVDDDQDMEMIDTQPHNSLSPVPWMTVSGSSPPVTQQSSPRLSLNVSGGRIATPIYGHFATDVAMEAADESGVHSDTAGSGEDEHAWWKKRRLPSPISESEDAGSMLSPRSRMGSWSTQPPAQAGGSTSQFLTANPQPGGDRGGGGGVRGGGVGGHHRQSSYDARTGITTVTTFSMGYRADCEKCVMKVPGHYAHIIQERTRPLDQNFEAQLAHG